MDEFRRWQADRAQSLRRVRHDDKSRVYNNQNDDRDAKRRRASMFRGWHEPSVIDDSGNKRRRLTYLDDLVIANNEPIMVIDNGCDQSIVNINSFLVQYFTGEYINIGGALSTMTSSNLEIVNDTFTIAILGDSTKIILKLN